MKRIKINRRFLNPIRRAGTSCRAKGVILRSSLISSRKRFMSNSKDQKVQSSEIQTPETGNDAVEEKKSSGCGTIHSVDDLPTGRRCFIAQASAAVLAAVAVSPAVIAAAGTVLTPIKKHFGSIKKEVGGAVKEYPVGNFADLPQDGTPVLVSIRDELVDGWSKEINVVGAIFARRTGENSMKVLHTMCPHMGSTVGFKEAETLFFCPSHSAYFDLDGKRLDKGAKNPCKRDMDELEARIVEDGMIYVPYLCFKSDSPEKIPV